MRYNLDLLSALEAEAIFVVREAVAQLEHPVLLFSGGKESSVLLRVAEKAFRPARLPFPIMHIDTGHNFPEALEFRHRRVAELGERLIVRTVQDSIRRGRVAEKVTVCKRFRLARGPVSSKGAEARLRDEDRHAIATSWRGLDASLALYTGRSPLVTERWPESRAHFLVALRN